jgi:hypothetical protein
MHRPAAPVGEALSVRTAAAEASVSARRARPLACVAPPAQFGRLTQGVGDLSAEEPTAGLSGPSVLVRQVGYRPRIVSVVLDDPIAAARSLRNHMEPADLMELIVILAEAAADGVGKRAMTQ